MFDLKNRKEIIFGGIISLVFVGFFVSFYFPSLLNNKNKKEEIIQKEKKVVSNPFDNLELEAQAVLVWDISKQEVIFSHNTEAQLPLASLTKLMTGLVASELVPEGSVVVIDHNNLAEEGDQGLLVGERWTLSNLTDFTLVTSSNDGASSLASVINSGNVLPHNQERNLFVKKMNQKAKELGLSQTFFLNESGLDVTESISGAYGSVKDITHLMEYILNERPNLLDATAYEKLVLHSYNTTHKVTNTNKIISRIPGAIASKTGFTDLAGGNLIITFDAGINHPIIVAVLGSSIDGRFEDVRKLIQASILKINSKLQ